MVRLGDHFLLVHERKHGQTWYVPAGRVEPGESFVDAAVRETREESGIDIVLEGILYIEHECAPEFARMRVVFVARPAESAVPRAQPNEHSLEAKWFTVEEMSELPLRAAEARTLASEVRDGAPVYPLSVLVAV
ncbi:MAG: phosphatase NudJ [Mycobacterium sp.]|nr:phosphatase NudJ [Mycobacterium sp.]